MCYVAFYACKRSAESQTLKVHPVASKTLTQKRPVYAAPERLVGDFSFSICFFREPSDVMRFPEPKWTNPRSSSHTRTFSVHFQLTGSPIDLHRAPWLVIDELGSRRNALRRPILTAFINLFSYSISSHTYRFYFGCECLCVLRTSFALYRCIAEPETTPVSQLTEQRASQCPDQSEHTGLTGSGGAGAPTSRLGERVNTHTIQRCCMRNQCEFGKLHSINLF